MHPRGLGGSAKRGPLSLSDTFLIYYICTLLQNESTSMLKSFFKKAKSEIRVFVNYHRTRGASQYLYPMGVHTCKPDLVVKWSSEHNIYVSFLQIMLSWLQSVYFSFIHCIACSIRLTASDNPFDNFTFRVSNPIIILRLPKIKILIKNKYIFFLLLNKHSICQQIMIKIPHERE